MEIMYKRINKMQECDCIFYNAKYKDYGIHIIRMNAKYYKASIYNYNKHYFKRGECESLKQAKTLIELELMNLKDVE